MKLLIAIFVICGFTAQVTSEGNLSCYYCDDNCNDPLEKTFCCPNTTSDYGDDLKEKYSCITSSTIIGGDRVHQKGCVFKDDIDVRWSCDKLNELEDSWCVICETNLCNSASRCTNFIILVCVISIFAKLL